MSGSTLTTCLPLLPELEPARNHGKRLLLKRVPGDGGSFSWKASYHDHYWLFVVWPAAQLAQETHW